MRVRYWTAAVVVLALLAQPAAGAAVSCNGTESGGVGQRQYQYDVVLEEGEAMSTHFLVGTCCLDPSHYSNVFQPAGWAWGGILDDEPEGHWAAHYADKTPHGVVSPGPSGSCTGWVLWYCTGTVLEGPGLYSFSFDNVHPSHDVGWELIVDYEEQSEGVTEDWSAPVGMGEGPVHGPIPEPATTGLLGLGLAAVVARRKRRSAR